MNLRLALGRFMVITGIPGHGKSEVLDALILNMSIMHNWKTMYFSPENNPEDEHVTALVEKYVGKEIKACTAEEVDKAIDYLQTVVEWYNPKKKTLKNILDAASNKKAKKGGLEWLIIDPWNYVQLERGQRSISEALSDHLNEITTFTREENILVTVVAHPTNLPKDKEGNTAKPDLYTINDGAQWRNKMDYGFVIHRDDFGHDHVDVSLGKRKKKWMGRVRTARLDYDEHSGRLKSRTDKEYTLPNQIVSPF
jgi:twinkle protein